MIQSFTESRLEFDFQISPFEHGCRLDLLEKRLVKLTGGDEDFVEYCNRR